MILLWKLNKLKWRPVGLHSWFFDIDGSTLNIVYNTFVREHLYHGANVFVHIERELHRVNFKKHGIIDDEVKEFFSKMISYAKKNGIVLEVNENQDNFLEINPYYSKLLPWLLSLPDAWTLVSVDQQHVFLLFSYVLLLLYFNNITFYEEKTYKFGNLYVLVIFLFLWLVMGAS